MAVVVTVAKGYDLGYIWKTQGQQQASAGCRHDAQIMPRTTQVQHRADGDGERVVRAAALASPFGHRRRHLRADRAVFLKYFRGNAELLRRRSLSPAAVDAVDRSCSSRHSVKNGDVLIRYSKLQSYPDPARVVEISSSSLAVSS